jgi:hypothetical protein
MDGYLREYIQFLRLGSGHGGIGVGDLEIDGDRREGARGSREEARHAGEI